MLVVVEAVTEDEAAMVAVVAMAVAVRTAVAVATKVAVGSAVDTAEVVPTARTVATAGAVGTSRAVGMVGAPTVLLMAADTAAGAAAIHRRANANLHVNRPMGCLDV